MLKTLRLKLTLLSLVLTGIIILVVCMFSFNIIKKQYIHSNEEAFKAAISDIFVQWSQTKSIDFTWLRSKEVKYDMLLCLEDNNIPLKFSQTNKKKIDRKVYTNYRNELTTKFKQAKSKYFQDKFEEHSKNIKKNMGSY